MPAFAVVQAPRHGTVECAASTDTDGSIKSSGSVTGDIDNPRDRGWFEVELVAGQTYVIDPEGTDSGGGTLDSAVLEQEPQVTSHFQSHEHYRNGE